MEQLQRVPVTITGFVFPEEGQTIADLQERFENNEVCIEFADNEEGIELEHATINEQE
jgi:hypothetical protein